MADHLVEQPVGAAVDVISAHHVVARAHDGAHKVVGGRESRGVDERVVDALERGEARLQGRARRVVRARVVVAFGVADAVLRVGAHLVDRRHHRAGGGIGRLTGVDREGIEARGLVGVAAHAVVRWVAPVTLAM